MVFKNSGNEYIFECLSCQHEFNSAPYRLKNGLGCPFCANQKLCFEKDCSICYKKSFASHSKAKYWSKNNQKQPRAFLKSSGKKCLFDCDECKQEFYTRLYSITAGTWCPYCFNKTEKKLLLWLQEKYGIEKIKYQPTFSWCRYQKTKKQARYDFLLTDSNIIIELDGDQHFKDVLAWQPSEHIRKNDIFKIEMAVKNDVKIIHILQCNVYHDLDNWKHKLVKAIDTIKQSKCIFIGNNSKYDKHCSDLDKLEIGYFFI